MKKLFKISTLLLLIPALFLTSCKDDDEGNSYVTLPPTKLQSHTGYEKVTLSWTAPNSNFLKEYLVHGLRKTMEVALLLKPVLHPQPYPV